MRYALQALARRTPGTGLCAQGQANGDEQDHTHEVGSGQGGEAEGIDLARHQVTLACELPREPVQVTYMRLSRSLPFYSLRN